MDVKDKIEAAYLQLLDAEEGDKITVKDVMEKCEISRSTFYYYYQDIFSVAEYSMQKQMREAVALALETDSPKQAIQVFAIKFRNNANLFRGIQHSKYTEIIEKMMVEIVRDGIEKLVHTRCENRGVPFSDMDMALDFYSRGFVSYMIELCMKGDFDPNVEADRLSRIFSGELVLFEAE